MDLRVQGKAIVNGKEQAVSGGSLAIVPAGAKHNFINTVGARMRFVGWLVGCEADGWV